MSDLTILVPTRGRPASAVEMDSQFQKTCTEDTDILFILDHDDPKLDEYLDANSLNFLITPKGVAPGMVAALNYGAAWLLAKGDPLYIGFMGDDHRPRTIGWDAAYLHALETHLFVYGADGIQNQEMPTQVAMDAKIPDVLGYMAPPQFFHLCIDLVWKDWGTSLNSIKYLPGVEIEHMHPAADKAKWDEGYERVNNQSVVASDSELYLYWKEYELPGEIEKLRGAGL